MSDLQQQYGYSADDLKDLVVSDQYTDRSTGRTYTYLQQTSKGVPVFNAIVPVIFANGTAYGLKPPFVMSLASKVNTIQPVLSPAQALTAALTHIEKSASFAAPVPVNGSTMKYTVSVPAVLSSPSEISLVLVPSEKFVRLAWNVTLDLKDGSHWWNIRIDALTGQYLEKNDWVVSCSFDGPHDHSVHSSDALMMTPTPVPGTGTAQYNVFPLPVESPIHGSRQLLNDPSEPVPSPYGWHDTNGAAGAEYNITRGNNVYAYEDANNDNLPGFSPDGGALQVFNFPYSIDSSTSANQSASLTNLFYMNNVIHDILHPNGFNEVAGNFQFNNYGNGGLGNDYVNAEGLDGGGTNNANFATPNDGLNPRMQMYLWTGGSQSSCSSLNINTPAAIAGLKSIGFATYNPASSFNITANIVVANDGVGTTSDGCSALTNAAAVAGKIVLMDRGTCNFNVKTQNAQLAGAAGVIIANNTTGVITMSGTPTITITIPSVSVSQADGNAIKAQLALPTTVNASLIICAPPPNRDGGFDNGIIAHEYGHGVSNRLTGGPAASSCLANGEQGGEGWSDWLGLITTIEPGDSGAMARGIGTYALFQATNGAGIRRYPYSTNMSINPQTYADLATSSTVHQRGEIWCDAIWDMTWFLIRDFGFDPNLYTGTSGNNIAMKLVLEGMKLQPCSPGYIDARDAILMADDILYSNAHRCQIWEAFARRGMGYGASQGSSNAVGDETVSFVYPAFCLAATLPPVADFTATQTTASCPSVIQFNDASLNTPQSWLWNFGDGGTSTQQNPSHTYAQPGQYSVKLKVTNTLGQDSIVKTNYITITSFSLAVTATPDTICQGDTVQLSAVPSSSNAIAGYNLSSIPYAPESGTGTAVSLSDDAVSAALPIGFSFNFYGNLYSSFYISSNGFIGFSSTMTHGCCNGVTIPSTGNPDNMIAFAWNDLNPSVNGSVISYFTTGVAPSRKLVVKFNTNHYNGTAYPMRGQIVLYEGSNVIEIHSEVITAVPLVGTTPASPTSQGIENISGTAGVSPSGRNAAVFGVTNDAVRFTPFAVFSYAWTPAVNLSSASVSNPLAWPLNTGNYTVTATDPNGCAVTQSTPVVVNLCLSYAVVNLKAFIEGFMNGSSSMQPILYQNGLHISPSAADSVTVELHAAAAPHGVQFAVQALLDINGNATANFPPAAAGSSYYIVVKSRNGIETWSKTPVLINAVTNFHFTP